MTSAAGLRFLFILFIVSTAAAFSWPRTRRTSARDGALQDAVPAVPEDKYELTITSTALDVVESDLASRPSYFSAQSRQKLDCWGQGIAFIRARCDSTELDEDERVRAAIALTVCDIRTARAQAVPPECAPFSPAAGLFATHRINERAQSSCVDAFSRSPFWSSYSGHLNNIARECFTYRSMSGRDTAKEMYHNITQEQLKLIQILRQREHDLARRDSENAQSAEARETAVKESLINVARGQADALDNSMRALSDSIWSRLDDWSRRDEDRLAQSSDLAAVMEGYLEDIRMESSFALAEASGKVTDLEKVLSHFLHRFEETRVQGVHEFTTELALTRQTHANQLQQLVTGLQEVSTTELRSFMGELRADYQITLEAAAATRQQIHGIGHDIVAVRETVEGLNQAANYLVTGVQRVEQHMRSLNESASQLHLVHSLSSTLESQVLGWVRFAVPQISEWGIHQYLPLLVRVGSGAIYMFFWAIATVGLFVLATSKWFFKRLRHTLDTIHSRHDPETPRSTVLLSAQSRYLQNQPPSSGICPTTTTIPPRIKISPAPPEPMKLDEFPIPRAKVWMTRPLSKRSDTARLGLPEPPSYRRSTSCPL